MTQGGTAAPVATVLENTTGATCTFSHDDIGIYVGTFSSAILDPAKTTLIVANCGQIPSNAISNNIYSWSASNFSIQTLSINTDGTNSYLDGILNATMVEIRIYN